jgi:hypothetical protein
LCTNNATTEYGGSCIFESDFGNEGVGSCRYNSPEEIKLREYVYQLNAAAAVTAAASGKQRNSIDNGTACSIPTAVNSPCYDSSSSNNATKHKHAQTHTVAAAALKASAHGSNSNHSNQHQQRARSLSDADTTANSTATTATSGSSSSTRESRSSKSKVQQRALSKSPTPAAAEATRQRASAVEISQAISAERSSLHRSSHNKH